MNTLIVLLATLIFNTNGLVGNSFSQNKTDKTKIGNVKDECGCWVAWLDPCCARIGCDTDATYVIGVDDPACYPNNYNSGTLVANAPGIDVCTPINSGPGHAVQIRFYTNGGRCTTFYEQNEFIGYCDDYTDCN